METERTDSRRALPGTFGLYHDDWGRLGLIDPEGRSHAAVEPVRMFPISDPEHWVAICDAQGHEVACVEDLARLPPDLRRLLTEELSRREFVPNILRILDVSNDSDPCQWHVETDRGRTRFHVGNEEDVRQLGPHRALVVDTHGIRYLVEDVRSLDAASRRFLDRYL
jgi:hypothetical protein